MLPQGNYRQSLCTLVLLQGNYRQSLCTLVLLQGNYRQSLCTLVLLQGNYRFKLCRIEKLKNSFNIHEKPDRFCAPILDKSVGVGGSGVSDEFGQPL